MLGHLVTVELGLAACWDALFSGQGKKLERDMEKRVSTVVQGTKGKKKANLAPKTGSICPLVVSITIGAQKCDYYNYFFVQLIIIIIIIIIIVVVVIVIIIIIVVIIFIVTGYLYVTTQKNAS